MNRLRAVCRASADARRLKSVAKSLLVLVHQVRERVEVVRHPRDDLLFGEPLGQRHLDRAVEGQRALVDLDQRAHRGPHRHRAADHRAAEPFPRHLDLLGQRDLFRSLQQRNLGHLAEIHPNRIAAELHDLAGRGLDRHGGHLALGQPLGAGALVVRFVRRLVELLGRRMVHQIDALFLQGDQQIVEFLGIDFLVGKVIVDFVVGQITLGFPPGDQFLQVLVEKVHRTAPFAIRRALGKGISFGR